MNISLMIMEVITGPEIIALVALMGCNVALSIIAAITKGEFSFRNLGDFVGTRVMPLLAYMVVALLSHVLDGWTPAAVAIYAGLVALYGAGIAAAVKSLTGVSIPNIFTEKRR
ncbi:unnamed protein product [marine sediment metagenome]|uniref:Uncharacterized protein n=1 Tax=marine sediment metagenome TaxID=412755 RepID=X1SE81_9ZZZZ